VLFSNLSDKDGGAVVAQLGKLNVPYRFSEGGGAVLVPVDHGAVGGRIGPGPFGAAWRPGA
jgi:flagellar biosynthesis/type III secretory pathway M-ring protein FliF/YscJ